jgi:hypothetical protein
MAHGLVLCVYLGHDQAAGVLSDTPNQLREDRNMPKFLTIGYGDQVGYERTPRLVRDAAHAQDAKLRAEGALMGIAGTPVQVRNPDATRVETLKGPYMVSTLPVAGFAVIEAADLADAIQKVSQVPCAVAHGVVEIWPLK